jgi:type I restriction enzyme S subunit
MTRAALPTAQLGRLVTPVDTWNPVRDTPETEFAYIDLGCVDNESKRIVGRQRVIGRDAPSRARQLVRAEDILVSTVRPNLNGVARVPYELDGATASTGFCVLRPKENVLDSHYTLFT